MRVKEVTYVVDSQEYLLKQRDDVNEARGLYKEGASYDRTT